MFVHLAKRLNQSGCHESQWLITSNATLCYQVGGGHNPPREGVMKWKTPGTQCSSSRRYFAHLLQYNSHC